MFLIPTDYMGLGWGKHRYRTLVECGRSKCGLVSEAEEAAPHDLTSLDRPGPLPLRRGGQSCQYIDIDMTCVHSTTTKIRFCKFLIVILNLN